MFHRECCAPSAGECVNLAVLGVLACFGIIDIGVISLCPNEGDRMRNIPPRQGCPALRSLKLSSVLNVGDDLVATMAILPSFDRWFVSGVTMLSVFAAIISKPCHPRRLGEVGL